IASPMRTRLAISTSTLGASAEKIEPATKLNPAAILVQRLPIVSDEVPPISAPNNAPKVTALTTSPCSAGPRWNSGTMKSIAPAITPVSKPNKRPPTAATAAINVMYKVALNPHLTFSRAHRWDLPWGKARLSPRLPARGFSQADAQRDFADQFAGAGVGRRMIRAGADVAVVALHREFFQHPVRTDHLHAVVDGADCVVGGDILRHHDA